MHEGEPIWLFKVLAYFLCGTKNRHLILVSNSLYIINNLFSRIFRFVNAYIVKIKVANIRRRNVYSPEPMWQRLGNSVIITRSISKVLKVFYNHKMKWPLNGVNRHINGCILCIYSVHILWKLLVTFSIPIYYNI